jgi:hypothetical protein
MDPQDLNKINNLLDRDVELREVILNVSLIGWFRL